MLLRPTVFSIFIFCLTSCLSLKSPTNTQYFSGTVKTCISDSTAIVSSSTIIISNNKKVNSGCGNKPNCSDCPPEFEDDWPAFLWLEFKNKKYLYAFDPQPADPAKPSERFGFRTQGGKLKYNKKQKTITLTSTDFEWTKTFTFVYDKNAKTFTLIDSR